MSSNEIPDFEQAEYTFEDKPVLATMMSGGVMISILMYFIVNWSLTSFGIQQPLIPVVVIVFIMYSSYRKSMTPDVVIKINTKTGWIYAKTQSRYWEGYIHQAEECLVLQRAGTSPRGEEYVEYKLFLLLHDESKYEIPVHPREASNVIQIVKKAKEVVPRSATDKGTSLT